MMRIVLSLTCVTLGACGLERDWAAWQALNQAGSDTGTASTGPDEAGTSSTSSSSHAETTAESTGTTQAAASTDASTGTTAESTSGTVETTGPAVVCGDGIVSGEEECDDPGDTACFNCIRDRLVFVTSKFDFRGDFSLLPQSLDYWCNVLAADAGLLINNTPRFKPWISTSEGSAAERLDHSKGRYVLRNGLVFALSWDALVAGEILNPLNVDENSQTQETTVWTDTYPDGSAMSGTHCNDWTSDSLELYASYGESFALDGHWTLYEGEATNPTFCGNDAAIYCFESP